MAKRRPKPATTAKRKTPRITAAILGEFWESNERRRAAFRTGYGLARALDTLSAELMAELDAAEKTTVRRGEFTVAIEDCNESIKWKDELIAAVGTERVAEIENAAINRARRLTVTKAEPPEMI